MAGGSVIRELATSVGFKSTNSYYSKKAEPSAIKNLPVIDNTVPAQKNVNTSVDCYVSGQYVQTNGKTIEVTQRYTVFVAYSAETQAQTMTELKARITSDFESRYGGAFSIIDVDIPSLPRPVPDEPKLGADPLEMYRGSSLFKDIAKFEKLRVQFDNETKQTIRQLKDRYKAR
jgi:hypothetical protein